MPLDYLYGILHGADAIQGYPDYIARFQGTVCYASARIDNYQVRGRVVGLSPFDDLGRGTSESRGIGGAPDHFAIS